MTYELMTVRTPNMKMFPDMTFSRPGYREYTASTMAKLKICMIHADVLDTENIHNDCPYPTPGERYHELLAHHTGEKMLSPDEYTQQEMDEFFEDAKKLRVWRGRRGLDPNKVLLTKFCSNDGWVVVPEECMLISEALGRLLDRMYKKPELTSHLGELTGWSTAECLMWVRQWQIYNFVASQSGGYEVW